MNDITQVIDKYSDMVYKLAYAKTCNKYDADDIYQEVFMRYVKKEREFASEEHRKAWLLRVTINCSNNIFSSLWRRNTTELKSEIVQDFPDDFGVIEELKKLSGKHRQIVHMFYYEGLSTKEIAEILRMKESTVRANLTRARAKLKIILKEYGHE